MIKLTKGPVPDVLERNAARWTTELLAQRVEDRDAETKARWKHKDIKNALKEETHEKCAYCESKPLHVTFGDIEHICPKSKNPEKSYDWNNLTLACEVCNVRKTNHENLVDPYEGEPRTEFTFSGPMLLEARNEGSAKRTRIVLQLNRKELLSQRCDHLAAIKAEYESNKLNPDLNERALTEAEIIAFYTAEDAEFSACATSFLHALVEN